MAMVELQVPCIKHGDTRFVVMSTMSQRKASLWYGLLKLDESVQLTSTAPARVSQGPDVSNYERQGTQEDSHDVDLTDRSWWTLERAHKHVTVEVCLATYVVSASFLLIILVVSWFEPQT